MSLRSKGKTLALQTKLKYRRRIELWLAVALPTADEGQRDPHAAGLAYAALRDALDSLTADRKAYLLVFKELAAYGLDRNPYGAL